MTPKMYGMKIRIVAELGWSAYSPTNQKNKVVECVTWAYSKRHALENVLRLYRVIAEKSWGAVMVDYRVLALRKVHDVQIITEKRG